MHRNPAILLTTFCLWACGDGTASEPIPQGERPFSGGPQTLTDAREAQDWVQTFTGGAVTDVQEIELTQGEGFIVDLELPSRSTARVTVVAHPAQVLEVESLDVRGIDTLEPGNGFVSLGNAIDSARLTANGTLVRWWFGISEDRWQYLLDFDDGVRRSRIYVDAHSGQSGRHDDGRDGGESDANDERDGGAFDAGHDRDGGVVDPECDPSDYADSLPSAAEAAARAILPGTVTKVERETEDGRPAWKIFVRTLQYAEVELRLFACTRALYRAEDDQGPFHYDLRPNPGAVSLMEAFASIRRNNGGYLERWRLRARNGRDRGNSATLVWELRVAYGDDHDDFEVYAN